MENKNLAIIPARGGSKRLPRKNILPLNGKPLILHTLEAVVFSKQFSKIILSSDDEEILKIGSSVKGVDLESRDATLAGDTVKVIDLVHAIARRPGYASEFEKIGLFLPTCPFRNHMHINGGLEMLTREDFSVVSMCEMGDPIQLSATIDHHGIINPEAVMSPSPLVTGQTRSQDFDKTYRVNGGFYIAWLDKFLKKENFFQGPVKGYIMERMHSIDIDHDVDLEYAELLIKKGYIKI